MQMDDILVFLDTAIPGVSQPIGAGYADDGSPEGTTWVAIRAGEQIRVNRILRAINRDQDGGLKRIEVTTTAPVHALAYRVNAYGDPVTLRPFRR